LEAQPFSGTVKSAPLSNSNSDHQIIVRKLSIPFPPHDENQNYHIADFVEHTRFLFHEGYLLKE
jgi:hypothetical protein